MDCLTLDIGGTKVAAAWWQGDRMVLRREEATPGHADAILALLARWVSDAPRVHHVGAAVTGVTDGRRLGVLNRQVIDGWDGLELADRLEQLMGIPALLLNDAQAAAWGEFRVRGGALQDLMFVTVSTGIGAGLVLGGTLRTGLAGLAGHLGHTGAGHAASSFHARCSCGRGVCLECVASGTAMQHDLAAAGMGSLSALRWMDGARCEAPAVQAWLEAATHRLANAIADAHVLLDLQCVVVGGGLGLHPRFLHRLQAALAGLPPRYRVPVLAAQLGPDAGLRGMALWLGERNKGAS